MNKAELIDAMSTSTRLSKVDCKRALEAVVEIIMKALKKGKSVVLTNFGTFQVVQRKTRTGVNPSTGEKMKIPARKVAKFKVGKKLKMIVN
jgi:DNA-binding protein HU-beta